MHTLLVQSFHDFVLTQCDKMHLRSALGPEMQIMTTDDQVLMSLFRDSFRPITGAEATEIVTNAPTRMMITRLDTDTPAPVHTVLGCQKTVHTLLIQSFNDFVLTQ